MEEKTLKVIFLGTPEFASVVLKSLLEWDGCDVVCVVSQPDKPKGRGKKLIPTPVKDLALRYGVDVIQPNNINDKNVVSRLRSFGADVLVVAAYGQILSSDVLNIAPLGAINVHASLLPKYRGASPIQWAMLKGEKITGITIMKMDEGLDTGPILAQKVIAIDIYDDAKTLHDKLAVEGAKILIKSLKAMKDKDFVLVSQDERYASYAPMLKKKDGLIDWNRPVKEVHNHIRAMYPWPGAHFYWNRPKDKKRIMLKVFPGCPSFEDTKGVSPGTILGDKSSIKIACKDYFYIPFKVQPESSKPLNPEAFFCGYLK